MKQLMTGLLVSVLLLTGGAPFAMAEQIMLRQSDGSVTPWGGVAEKGSVTCDNCSGGAGGMVDDAAFTPGTTTGTPSFFMFDDVAPDSVNEGDGGVGRMSANRNQYVTIRDAAGNERGLNIGSDGSLTAQIVQGGNTAAVTASGTLKITNYDSSGNEIVVPTAGLTSYTAAGATTNATSVKGSAGTIYHYTLTNTTTTIYYLRMYNLASSPTCSSSTGYVATIPIPPAAAAGGAGGREIPQNIGQAFTTGIGFCITGGSSSTDNTAAATGVFVEILYK